MSTGNTSTSNAAVSVQPSTPVQRYRSINPTQNVLISPSSTTVSESGASTSFRQTEELAVRAHPPVGFLPARKITIRSDPALLTCFDATDKQLYDLWAPKT